MAIESSGIALQTTAWRMEAVRQAEMTKTTFQAVNMRAVENGGAARPRSAGTTCVQVNKQASDTTEIDDDELLGRILS